MDRLLTRDEALARRPHRISDDVLARCVWVHREHGFDETCIQLFNVSAVNAGYLFQRQVWWFEEESLEWTLDENHEWWMPPAEAHALLGSLNAALTPSAAAQTPPSAV